MKEESHLPKSADREPGLNLKPPDFLAEESQNDASAHGPLCGREAPDGAGSVGGGGMFLMNVLDPVEVNVCEDQRSVSE